MKKIRNEIKKQWSLHWNCLPWLVAGIFFLVLPRDINKLEYFVTWAVLMGFLWQRPVKEDECEK